MCMCVCIYSKQRACVGVLETSARPKTDPQEVAEVEQYSLGRAQTRARPFHRVALRFCTKKCMIIYLRTGARAWVIYKTRARSKKGPQEVRRGLETPRLCCVQTSARKQQSACAHLCKPLRLGYIHRTPMLVRVRRARSRITHSQQCFLTLSRNISRKQEHKALTREFARADASGREMVTIHGRTPRRAPAYAPQTSLCFAMPPPLSPTSHARTLSRTVPNSVTS